MQAPHLEWAERSRLLPGPWRGAELGITSGRGPRALEAGQAGLFGSRDTVSPSSIYWALPLCPFTGLDETQPCWGLQQGSLCPRSLPPSRPPAL